MYTRNKCLLHSQDEAGDKIAFDCALKLNRTIIIGCIHPFRKHLKSKDLHKHRHINTVYPFQWHFFCKKQVFSLYADL